MAYKAELLFNVPQPVSKNVDIATIKSIISHHHQPYKSFFASAPGNMSTYLHGFLLILILILSLVLPTCIIDLIDIYNALWANPKGAIEYLKVCI